MKIRPITFEQILPFWQNHLWPGRQSVIEPTSAIQFLGGYDMSLMSVQPYFYSIGVEKDGQEQVVGVTSGFKCSESHFRLRGTWIAPQARGRGCGRQLVEAVENKARQSGCQILWTLARKDSAEFYGKLNFQIAAETNEFEFGPHYFMAKNLASSL